MTLLWNRDLAQTAFNLELPGIDDLVRTGITSSDGKIRRDLHVIIGWRNQKGEGAVFYATNYGGDPRLWDHPFDTIANAKFDISVRTGLPSRAVHSMEPEWLEDGDVRFGGSFVLGPIVAAVSGFQSYVDELVCARICHTGRMLIHRVRERLEADAVVADDDNFLVRNRPS